MSKIFERLIHDHLMDHCREAAVIPPEQTGFQRSVSCDHHLVKLQTHTIERMKNNYTPTFISLDCTQAFESVSQPLLLRRLEEFRFPAALCDWSRTTSAIEHSWSGLVEICRPQPPPPVECLKGLYLDLYS
nr:uncharacterized protein LOC106680166 [Halyomorpha halys]